LIVVDHNTQATDMTGVFAGGDATKGTGTVIEAVSAGRRAANTIAEYLKGQDAGEQKDDGGNVDSLLIFNTDCLNRTNRAEISERPLSERNVSEEDYLGLEETEMEKEANRCFNCGCVAVSPSDIAPALIALNAKIKTTKRIVEAEKFFAIGPLKSTILDLQELVTEIQIPSPNQDSNATYSKFRMRQSIDFPIVSVASVIATDCGKIDDARIVLGAMAPVPLRARETEDFLRGKEISEDLAEEASAIAVKAAVPLHKNAYKIQIARALVKRAILDAAERD
jgi:CO/xanthine dehydrogenase FAD-binding subunit